MKKTERKVEADEGCYDDTVIMLGLALKGHEEPDLMEKLVEKKKPEPTRAMRSRQQALRKLREHKTQYDHFEEVGV